MAGVSLYLSFYSSLLRSILTLVFARLYTPQQPPSRDLSGQIALVTGANSGIGLSIATTLAKQGATVYLGCRNLEKGDAAVDEVIAKAGVEGPRRVFCWKVDVGDVDSVRQFCERWVESGRKLDMVVHNAGIASLPPGAREMNEKGLDFIYATNFLGSFLMTHLLEQSLSATARVVFTSSTSSYTAIPLFKPRTSATSPNLFTQKLALAKESLGLSSSAPAYARSKAQQVLFTHLLQRHFSSTPGNKRSAHSFLPGFTSTPIFSKYEVSWRLWVANPLFSMLKVSEKWAAVDTDEGAKTGVWLASRGDEVDGGHMWEWMTQRTSLIDLVRALYGEERFLRKSKREWQGWEGDAGVEWALDS